MKTRRGVRWVYGFLILAAITAVCWSTVAPVAAAPLPGGTLDPLSIPKYVTPLVIPPEMPKSTISSAPAASYDIAVRQFKQQILPGGIWGASFPNPLTAPTGTIAGFGATTIWSYGRNQDPLPDSSAIPGGAAGVAPAMNSSFNYPSFTVEATAFQPTTVRWINDLKDPATGNFLPHLFTVDQTLHWANPPKANCVMMPANRTDCETAVGAPYTGPVPLVTHVHGAHVQPHSDGYPEAWWLPAANNIPAGYATKGTHFGQADPANTVPGSAYFSYENSQAATTIWYHDHALGMTRLNVYAGPAGFWLVRGGAYDLLTGLPKSAPSGTGDPNFDAAYRNTVREVPIAIQDRSFNSDGSLFYPADRTFFDGFTGPFIGGTGTPAGPSDMSPIWNPEAFFNTMVVNGTTWPMFEVANGRYRLRLLDGCNSRTLNLALYIVTSVGADGVPGTADDVLGAEVPFYQIGAEQGFLPKVVKITTGFATQLPGDGTIPAPVAATDPAQALLMGPAERADVIVDFKGMANGTRIRMINTGPDVPFGGFPIAPADAPDPLTTGQVMDFVVNTALETLDDSNTTAPESLVLPAEPSLGASTNTRQVSLNEMSSDQVCAEFNAITGAYVQTLFSTFAGDPNFLANCASPPQVVGAGNMAAPMGPRQARLGIVATSGPNLVSVPKRWSDHMTEVPALNSIETWEIFNTTVDAHPIHVHLVAFQVVNRQALDSVALLAGNLVVTGPTITPNANESGFKDTVVALPGQVTRLKAKFDIAGLYVWHCHIVEHEDNEMMRPYCVANADGSLPAACALASRKLDKIGVFSGGTSYLDKNGSGAWEGVPVDSMNTTFNPVAGGTVVAGDWMGTGMVTLGMYKDGVWYIDLNGNGLWDGAPTDGLFSFGTGLTNALPVVGDWTGTGTTKIGVYDNGVWYLDLNGNGAWDGTPTDAMNIFGIGLVNALPVAGDWDGTGKSKIGIYVDGTWYIDLNGNGAWDGTPTDSMDTFGVGLVGSMPVAGDWTMSGTTKIGVYVDGTWYLDLNGNRAWDGTPTDVMNVFGVGLTGVSPVVGMW